MSERRLDSLLSQVVYQSVVCLPGDVVGLIVSYVPNIGICHLRKSSGHAVVDVYLWNPYDCKLMRSMDQWIPPKPTLDDPKDIGEDHKDHTDHIRTHFDFALMCEPTRWGFALHQMGQNISQLLFPQRREWDGSSQFASVCMLARRRHSTICDPDYGRYIRWYKPASRTVSGALSVWMPRRTVSGALSVWMPRSRFSTYAQIPVSLGRLPNLDAVLFVIPLYENRAWIILRRTRFHVLHCMSMSSSNRTTVTPDTNTSVRNRFAPLFPRPKEKNQRTAVIDVRPLPAAAAEEDVDSRFIMLLLHCCSVRCLARCHPDASMLEDTMGDSDEWSDSSAENSNTCRCTQLELRIYDWKPELRTSSDRKSHMLVRPGSRLSCLAAVRWTSVDWCWRWMDSKWVHPWTPHRGMVSVPKPKYVRMVHGEFGHDNKYAREPFDEAFDEEEHDAHQRRFTICGLSGPLSVDGSYYVLLHRVSPARIEGHRFVDWLVQFTPPLCSFMETRTRRWSTRVIRTLAEACYPVSQWRSWPDRRSSLADCISDYYPTPHRTDAVRFVDSNRLLCCSRPDDAGRQGHQLYLSSPVSDPGELAWTRLDSPSSPSSFSLSSSSDVPSISDVQTESSIGTCWL